QAPSAPRGVPGGSAPQASTVRLPPPRHAGTLRVTGALRDGGTVRAAGLSWRPGELPPGDRLLSFEVGYYWSACTAAGQCRPAAPPPRGRPAPPRPRPRRTPRPGPAATWPGTPIPAGS